MDQPVVLLRLPEVMKRTGLGRTTIYKLVGQRKFPAPVQLSGRAVGWRAEQIDDWSRTRPTAEFAADIQPRVVLRNARRRAA
jgi:prophage regulatory protein